MLLFNRDLYGEVQIVERVDRGTIADFVECYLVLAVLWLIIGWAHSMF
jgi:hypothetical protein